MIPTAYQQPSEAKGRGPVQRQLLAQLRSEFGLDFSIALSNRSPFGHRAFRIRPNACESCDPARNCKPIASALRGKAWVESASSTTENIYVRPTLEAMRAWCLLDEPDSNADRPERGAEQVVVYAESIDSGGSGSLRACRIDVIVRAVIAQLQWTGAQARHDPKRLNGYGPVSGGPRIITVGTHPQDDLNNLAVGSVDVEHGALRSRCGGSIGIHDFRLIVRNEIVVGFQGRWQPDMDPDCALAFILGRAERRGHLRVSQTRLTSELAAYSAIIGATSLPHKGPDEERPPCDNKLVSALGELFLELELLPWTADQAASAFEPALVLRYLVNLSRRVRDAGSCLAGEIDLSAAIRNAIALGLSLSGCGGAVVNDATHTEG
jgi:hypothetical protein